MANIDNLSINISLAKEPVERNINSIISSLDALDRKFSAVSSLNNFREGLNSLTTTFLTLSEAINGLDIKKFQSMNTSLSALARNVGALNSVGQSISAIGKATAVSSKSRRDIEEKIDQLESLKERAIESKAALQSITIGRTGGDLAESGDEFKRLNGLGGNIGKNKNGYGINPEAYGIYREITGQELSQNAAAFTEYTGEIQRLDEQIKKYTADIDKLNEELKTAPQVISQVKSAIGDDEFLDFGDEKPSWEMAFDTVEKKAEEIKSVGNPFENVLVGLQSLENVSIPAEQFAGINELASGIAKMSKADLGQISTNLPQLANSLVAFENVPTANTESIYNLAASLNKLGGKKIVDAAASLPIISETLNSFSTIQFGDTENLISLASALKKFGSAGIEKATAILPQFTEQLRNLMVQLGSAPQVSENVVRLAEAMAKFSTRTQGATSTNALNLFGDVSHRSGRKVRSLASAIGLLYAKFFLLFRLFRQAGKAIDLSSSFTEAQNVVDVAFGKMSDKMYDFAENSIRDFGLAKLSAMEFASRFQAMGKTMGISADEIVKANTFIANSLTGNERAYKDLGDSVADMSVNLTKLTADIASLYNQDYEDVAKDMQAIYTGMTRPLRKYGIDLTNASMKEFALKNGLDANIESMSQAEKTMLRYQMVMTRAGGAMGDFQKTADTWANTMRTIKQLIGEWMRLIGEGFINALRPALIAFREFMYNLISVTEWGLNAIGKLLGWKQINFGGASLVEDTEDYADALDDAAGSAKKLKGQLRGIDELNNYTSNNGGGGGGNGADSLLNANGDSIWDNIIDSEKEYTSNVKSWYDLGRRISNNIQAALEAIDWEEIKTKVGTGAKNFASFLNGLFKPEMFKAIGSTVAEGINTGLTAAYEFGKEFDFENFGVSVREGIKGFLEDFDWELLAENINLWVHGFMDFLKGLFGDKQLWKDMFDAAAKLIGTLDLSTLEILCLVPTLIFGASAVRNALVSGITTALGESVLSLPAIAVAFGGGLIIGNGAGQIVSYLSGNQEDYEAYRQQNPFTNDSTFGQMNDEFWTNVFDFWKDNNPASMIYNLGVEVGRTFREAILGELEYFKNHSFADFILDSFFDTEHIKRAGASSSFDNVPDEVKKQLGLENNVTFKDIGIDIVKGIKKGIDEQLSKTKYGSVLKSIFDGICKVFGIQSPAKEMYPVGENIILGIIEGFSLVDFKQRMTEWWDNSVTPWFAIAKWSGIANNIKTAIGTKWNETVTQWITNITSWWNNNVAPWFTYEKWSGITQNIRNSIITKFSETISTWAANISSWWNNYVAPYFTLDKWRNIADNIRAGIVAKWNETVVWFSGAVGGILTKAKNTLTYTEFYKIGENIGNALKQPFQSAINTMTNLWNTLKTLISGGLSMTVKINGDASGLSDTLEAAVGNVDLGKTIVETVKDQLNDDAKKPNPPATTSNYKSSTAGMPSNIKMHANGGFPEIGSMFIAGETYGQTEWLGNINGRTGVVGGAEITGIRDAIVSTSNAEITLLRQQNQLLQGILQKEFGISSTDLFNSVRSSANSFQRRTGSPAF